jgi:hypothetical protein
MEGMPRLMDALVQWDSPGDSDLVGYNVWHGYGVGSNPAVLDFYFEFFTVLAPTLQKSFTGLDDFKTHHFTVTAFDEVPNEGALSTNVSTRIPHRFTMK